MSDLLKCQTNSSYPTDPTAPTPSPSPRRPASQFSAYLQHASTGNHHFLFTHNFRVWNVCQNLLPSQSACFLPKMFQQVRLTAS